MEGRYEGTVVRELIREKGFWSAVLLALIGMAAAVPFYQIKLPLETGQFVFYYQSALGSRILGFLLPVAAVLPMGAVYVREASGGFLKLYLARISRSEYIRRKTIQIYVSGFLTFFAAGVILLICCFLFLYPLEVKGDFPIESFLDAGAMLLRICLVGGMLAEISGIFAVLFQNYYMAYGLPFVCYYLLIILKERYLPKLYCLYPVEWIQAEQFWGSDGTGLWIFLAVVSAAVMSLHGLLLHYRLQEI